MVNYTKRHKKRSLKNRKGTRRSRVQYGGQYLIREIATEWRRRRYGVVSGRNGHYFLNCGEEDEDNHIHLIEPSQRYIYKRDGNHDNAEGRGYGFTDDSQWCVEQGADVYWDYRNWTTFLHRRMCNEGRFGRCRDPQRNSNNNNGNNNNNNGNQNMGY